MLRRNLLNHLIGSGAPRSYKALSFVTVALLFFGCGLTGHAQVFKPTPVLYRSGGSAAASVAVADVNKDGKPDAIVINQGIGFGGSLGVLLGNVDGTFQTAVTYAMPTGAYAVAVGDLNGDSWPDLVVGVNDGEGVTSLLVLLNNGDGTFKTPMGYSSAGFDILSVAIADVNGDGKQDVIALDQANSNFTHSEITVLLGNGDGTLATGVAYPLTSSGTNSLSLAVADLNGDGKPDLVLTDSSDVSGVICVMLNSGDGTFPTQARYPSAPSGYYASSVVLADVNLDGKLDAIVASDSVSVLFGNGDGTFGTAAFYPTGSVSPLSLAVGDFNGDGAPDVVAVGTLTNDYPDGRAAVLLNNGDGTFQAPIVYPTGGRKAVSAAVANLNQDAKPDLVVADQCDGFNSTCPLGGGVAVLLGVPGASKTTVTTSGSPSQNGQPVTFTATVTSAEGPIENGTTITFYNNGAKIGTAKTTNGVATFTTSSLAVGTHTIKAGFPSSAFFKASFATITQVVN